MFNQLIRSTEKPPSNRLQMINKWAPIFHAGEGFHGLVFVNEDLDECSIAVLWDSEEAAMQAAKAIKKIQLDPFE